MVRPSTPVASTAKWPPFRTEKSRSRTLRHSFGAMSPCCPARPWRRAAASGSSPAGGSGPMLSGRLPLGFDQRAPGAPPCQAAAVDPSWADDGHVLEADAPEQAVLPVAVAEVLVEVRIARLRQVVACAAHPRFGGEQRGGAPGPRCSLTWLFSRIEWGWGCVPPQGSRRFRPRRRRGLDRGVDRGRVQRSTVAPHRRRARRRPAWPDSLRGPARRRQSGPVRARRRQLIPGVSETAILSPAR